MLNRKWPVMLAALFLAAALLPAGVLAVPELPWNLNSNAPEQVRLTIQDEGTIYLCGLRTNDSYTMGEAASWMQAETWAIDLRDGQGNALPAEALCATGNVLVVLRTGEPEICVVLVVGGDLTGSGRVDLSQVVMLAQAMNGQHDLSPAQLLAADLNSDGRVGIGDVVLAARILTGNGGSLYSPLYAGMQSGAVQTLQVRLHELGYLTSAFEAGTYDASTGAAVAAYQVQAGLEATGAADAVTLESIYSPDAPACPRPLAGLTIGIDPGHQARGNAEREPVAPGSSMLKAKVSSGTEGIVSHVEEYAVNLSVGLKLRRLLEEQGASVVMTRETNAVDISNAQRAQMMNAAGADLVIRLHCDGEDDTSRHGAFVLVPSGPYTAAIQDPSREAARMILSEFIRVTGARNLGLSERSDQTGFNWSTVPVINIEMGHLSNPDEDRRLASDAYQALCAEGIAQGVLRWAGA